MHATHAAQRAAACNEGQEMRHSDPARPVWQAGLDGLLRRSPTTQLLQPSFKNALQPSFINALRPSTARLMRLWQWEAGISRQAWITSFLVFFGACCFRLMSCA